MRYKNVTKSGKMMTDQNSLLLNKPHWHHRNETNCKSL